MPTRWGSGRAPGRLRRLRAPGDGAAPADRRDVLVGALRPRAARRMDQRPAGAARRRGPPDAPAPRPGRQPGRRGRLRGGRRAQGRRCGGRARGAAAPRAGPAAVTAPGHALAAGGASRPRRRVRLAAGSASRAALDAGQSRRRDRQLLLVGDRPGAADLHRLRGEQDGGRGDDLRAGPRTSRAGRHGQRGPTVAATSGTDTGPPGTVRG